MREIEWAQAVKQATEYCNTAPLMAGFLAGCSERGLAPETVLVFAKRASVNEPALADDLAVLNAMPEKEAWLRTVLPLIPALVKEAVPFQGYEQWSERHPLMDTALAFTPVGAATSGMDAVNAFSRGNILSGLGHTGLAALGLFGLGGLFKGVGRGISRTGRALIPTAGRAMRVGTPGKVWGARSHLPRAAPGAGHRIVSGAGSRMAPAGH